MATSLYAHTHWLQLPTLLEGICACLKLNRQPKSRQCRLRAKTHHKKASGFAFYRSHTTNVTAAKLHHHYSTMVYDTLSIIPSQQRLWQILVVQIAFRHNFLLRGILAMSAQHLAHTNSEIASQFILEAAEDQQAVLAKFRPLVSIVNVSTEILRPLFLSSCFLSKSAFGQPRAEGGFDQPTQQV